MELYFLDEDFSPISGAVDRFTSVVWSERYFETGTFTLHFPGELLREVMNAVYVSTSSEGGEIKCGRIEYITDNGEGDCEMGGRLLESLLSDRIICGEGVMYGNVADAVMSAVDNNLRDFGITVGPCDTVSATSSLQYDWSPLSDWLYSALKPYGASFTVKLDGDSGRPVFRLVTGKNRTVDGCDEGVQPAVFSGSFGNISSVAIRSDSSRMKNYIYVEGSDGTVVTVDKSEGGRIREMYRKAGDIAPGAYMTQELYREALIIRGEELLSKHKAAFAVSAECDGAALPRYGVDYFLGDICDVADEEHGLSFDMRLTGVDTVWENGCLTVYPLFGEEIRYIDRLKEKLQL